jgi:hypothetical protein
MAAAWQESRQIRQFLEAVDASLPDSEQHEGLSDWMAWARAYADARDPLRDPETIAKALQPRSGSMRSQIADGR